MMEATLPDTIRARRHPHQVFIAGLCVVAGLPILAGGPAPGTLAAAIPPWLLGVWSAVLVLGGALVVAAAIVRHDLAALYLEGAAHLPLAVMTVAYAVALIAAGGARGLVAAAIFLGFGVASAVRFAQVTAALRRVRSALRRTSHG